MVSLWHGPIPINRANRAGALAEVIQARDEFTEGRRLIIFPEGHGGRLALAPDYRSGVAHVQKNTGVVCVPVALNTGLFCRAAIFAVIPARRSSISQADPAGW